MSAESGGGGGTGGCVRPSASAARLLAGGGADVKGADDGAHVLGRLDGSEAGDAGADDEHLRSGRGRRR